MAGTKFSDYLGLKHYKKAKKNKTFHSFKIGSFSDYLGLKHYKKSKKIKHFIHLRLAQRPQSFNTHHTISPTVNSGH